MHLGQISFDHNSQLLNSNPFERHFGLIRRTWSCALLLLHVPFHQAKSLNPIMARSTEIDY